MAYHINAEKVCLDDLRKRLEATDLVPSRTSLKENTALKMKALENMGIRTLADLRNGLKNAKHLELVAKTTGIDAQYLVLLRREIEGYFPKPVNLKTFAWLPQGDIAKLEQNGIGDTVQLFETAHHVKNRTELAKATGVALATLEALLQLADLMRVQWVSPTFAQMLVAAGYDSAARVATAVADDLYDALQGVNSGDKFFKGKLGLRDIKRLIMAASYV